MMEMGFTNVILAENKILKKKLEYIKDLIQDEIYQGFNHPIYDSIKAICENKTCNTCKWWEKEDITDGMVCVNADSDDVTEWTDGNHSCKCWEKCEKLQKNDENSEN